MERQILKMFKFVNTKRTLQCIGYKKRDVQATASLVKTAGASRQADRNESTYSKRSFEDAAGLLPDSMVTSHRASRAQRRLAVNESHASVRSAPGRGAALAAVVLGNAEEKILDAAAQSKEVQGELELIRHSLKILVDRVRLLEKDAAKDLEVANELKERIDGEGAARSSPERRKTSVAPVAVRSPGAGARLDEAKIEEEEEEEF